MSKLPPAGNNVQTLQSKPASTADVAVLEKAAVDRLTAAKERIATAQHASLPTASATHPPTGPAPIEFKEPIKTVSSPAGPAPTIIHESITAYAAAKTDAASTVANTPSSLAARIAALEDRLSNFNTRSGQKI